MDLSLWYTPDLLKIYHHSKFGQTRQGANFGYHVACTVPNPASASNPNHTSHTRLPSHTSYILISNSFFIARLYFCFIVYKLIYPNLYQTRCNIISVWFVRNVLMMDVLARYKPVNNNKRTLLLSDLTHYAE